MRKIIYIHGFASSGNSYKGELLREEFGSLALTPDLKSKPAQDIAHLSSLIETCNNPILIGSSLGGFYAEYLSKTFKLDALLINPVAEIEDTKFLIGEHNYFSTNDTFFFTDEDFNVLLEYGRELENIESESEKRVILTATDDIVLDYKKTVKHFIRDNERVVVYDYGEHSFNLKNEILENLKTLF